MDAHSEDASLVFVCQTCGKGFQNENSLAEHNIASHLANTNSYMEISPISGESRALPKGASVMASEAQVEEGEKVDGEINSNISQQHDANSVSVQPGRKTLIRGKRTFRCTECNEEFKKKRELTVHMLTHPEAVSKNKICDICHKEFSQVSALLKHRRIHSGDKPFKCNVCEKAFNAMCNLVTHQRTHTGEKPFVCRICEKRFSVQCNLTTHERTHSGEKPYSCDLCGKSFTVFHNLITHKRTHSGEKPFPCNICDKQFSVHCNLITHLRTHSDEKPFICKICGKCFRAQCNLTTHLHVHSTEKPYSCETCGKCFSRPIGLARHKDTHSDIKKYECSMCDKGFNSKQSLTKHLVKHTKGGQVKSDVSFVVSNGTIKEEPDGFNVVDTSHASENNGETSNENATEST